DNDRVGDQKLKLTRIAACSFLAMALTLSAVNMPAQEGRKVISNPAPDYPEMAKQFHITGVVKVQVVIAPDGHIKSTNVIGCNPVLTSAVEETLKNWKYAPASGETTAILEFSFHPEIAKSR
ncbi:MAG: energy transducer TonB, partial [Candidatus Acidiferrum sp.]